MGVLIYMQHARVSEKQTKCSHCFKLLARHGLGAGPSRLLPACLQVAGGLERSCKKDAYVQRCIEIASASTEVFLSILIHPRDMSN